MLRRILLVNLMPLILLLAALLYLDQYQNGLLEAEVGALREQAKIYAAALAESAVNASNPADPKLVPEIVRPLLRRVTEPTPDAQAKVYAPDGTVIADSAAANGLNGPPEAGALPPAITHGRVLSAIGWVYDKVLSLLPSQMPSADLTPGGAGPEWQPNVKEELRLSSSDQSREMPPYIRRTGDNRLLVTVAEPIERNRHTVGIILLTREAREVDASLFAVRMSILGLFALGLALTVLLSWYLSLTIARPILRLAAAAAEMREGQGRTGSVPPRRCGTGWTRSNASPPTWRMRSRTRCPRSAAP
jgi:two-component system sensor histidine kinase ChvG